MMKLLCVLWIYCGHPAAPLPSVPEHDPAPPPVAAAPQNPSVLPPEVAGDEQAPSDAAPQPAPAAIVLREPASAPPAAPGVASTAPAAGAGAARGSVAAVPPAWRRFAVSAPPADGKPTLTIIIDDMGMNQVQSARALALPGPLTLSWLPYAPHLSEQVASGAARGDETMVHMPMEALGRMFPGPNTLRTWLPPDTNLAYLRAALDSIPNAVALNQHEGSVASLSVPLMDGVMGELKDRGLAFLDSLTIPHSVALRRAHAAGLPAVARDVFLDNDPNPTAIRARLAEVEMIARHYGHAIAICHPRQTTIDVLEQYLPTVGARGIVLWPVSAAIATENRIQLSAAPGH